jgi:hypothetical protein
LELVLDGSTHLQGIGSVPLINTDGNRLFALKVHGAAAIAFLSKHHPAHIFEP